MLPQPLSRSPSFGLTSLTLRTDTSSDGRRTSTPAFEFTTFTSVEIDDTKQTRTSSSMYSVSTVISEFAPLNTGYSEHLLEYLQSSRSTPLPDKAKVGAILDVRKAEVGVIALALVETFLELGLMVVDWHDLRDRDDMKKVVPETIHQHASRLSGVGGGSGEVLFVRDIVEVLFRREDCELLLEGRRVPIRTMGLPMFASGYFEAFLVPRC